MNLLKERWPFLLVSLLEICIGIVLLIQPVNFTNIAIIITGILLIVRGFFCAVRYVRAEQKVAAKEQALSKALILLAAGMFFVLDSKWVLNTFSTPTLLYGVAILAMGFFKVQRTVDMLRAKNERWLWSCGSALFALAVGLVILWNPFGNINAVWTFTGISLLVESVVDLVSLFLRSKKANA